MPSHVEGTTFLLVLQRQVDPHDTAEEFIKSFLNALNRKPPEKQHELVGGFRKQQARLMAIPSDGEIVYEVGVPGTS